MSKTVTSTTTNPERVSPPIPNPEIMPMIRIVSEINHNSIDQKRKKELYAEIISRPVKFDNVNDWILAFKMNSPTNPLASKVTAMVKFIYNLCCEQYLLKEICESTNLPKEIIQAACWKSKNRIDL